MISDLPQRRPTRLPDRDYSSPGAYFVTICCQNRIRIFDFAPARTMIESVWRDITARFPTVDIDQFVIMPDHFHGILVIKPTDFDLSVGVIPCGRPSPNEEKSPMNKHLSIADYSVGAIPCGRPSLDEEKSPMNNHLSIADLSVGAIPFGRPSPNEEKSRNNYLSIADLSVGAIPCGRPSPNEEKSRNNNLSRGRKREDTRPSPTVSDVISAFKSETTWRWTVGVKEKDWPPFEKRIWQRSFYDHVIRNDEDLRILRDYIENNPKALEMGE